MILMCLSACGGSGGGDDSNSTVNTPPPPDTPPTTATAEACFKGITVAGLPFFTDIEQGVTDERGCFWFTPQHAVTFFVGTRSGTDVQGNVLGVVNAQDQQQITVATLSQDVTTQENLERFLLVARSKDDLSRGIVLTTALLDKAATLPQLDFSKDISQALSLLQSVALNSGDGGSHASVDAGFARILIDASARCANTGFFDGFSSGRTAGATTDDLDVRTELFVYPPAGAMSGTIAFRPKKAAQTTMNGVLPFSIGQPLSTTAPGVDLNAGGLTLKGTFGPPGVFNGSASYQSATLNIRAFGSLSYMGSTQRFTGGDPSLGMTLEVSAGQFVGLVLGLPGSNGIVWGSFNADGTIAMWDPNQLYYFDAQFLAPSEIGILAYTIAGGPGAYFVIDGCTR